MVILLNIEYVRILKKLDRKGKHNSQITSLTLPNLSTMTSKATVTLKITTVYEFFKILLLILTVLLFIDHKFDLSAGASPCVRYSPHPQSVFGRSQAPDGVIPLILTNVQRLSGICYEKWTTLTSRDCFLELHMRSSRDDWTNHF